MALFVSNTSGIYGRKKVDWEYYGPHNTLVVFISNGGIDGNGLILGLFFLEAIKRLQTADSNKYNLVRHEKNCKCNKLQMNQTNNSNENKIIITNDVNKNIIELINKLSERLDKLYEIVINNNIIKNDKIENSKNIIHENIKYDNHIELNNSNNNNKTIINNQTIINNNKIIYPYGYENLNHLTKLQMLDILHLCTFKMLL